MHDGVQSGRRQNDGPAAMLVLMLAVIACNPRPTAPRPRRPDEIARARKSGVVGEVFGTRPFFVAGETHVWSYSFLGFTVARTRVAIGEPVVHDGKRLIDVSWQLETVGLAAQFVSAQFSSRAWIDTETGVSLSTSYQGDMKMIGKLGTKKKQGSMHSRAIITRDDKANKLRIQTWEDGKKPTDRLRAIPKPHRYDPASAFLVLRGWDAPIGGRAKMSMGLPRGGGRGGRGHFELVVEARELLHSKLGRMPTVRIAGFKNGRKKRTFTLWISNDKKRLPLRMAFHTKRGDFVIEAVRYTVSD